MDKQTVAQAYNGPYPAIKKKLRPDIHNSMRKPQTITPSKARSLKEVILCYLSLILESDEISEEKKLI